jgi:hypothetical protein
MTPGEVPMPGLADAVQAHLNDLWGTPSAFEKKFGKMLENTPGLRNHVANPTMALRGLARTLTKVQTALKLSYNIKSSAVNLVQPLTTLWPYVSTKEYAGLYADIVKPTTRAMLREKGVYAGATKLETTGTTIARKSQTPFNKTSEINRGIGYLYGYRSSIKKGLSEEQAHANGLSWAEKVEFDNSTWNVQPAIRSNAGRVVGQFKSFMGKNLENIREVVSKQSGTRAQQMGRKGKFAAAQLTMGGLSALPKALVGYAVYDQLRKQLESFGMDSGEAQTTAKAVYMGAPSLIGQDLSGSVTIADFYGDTLRDKVANFTLGPTIGTGIDVAEGTARTLGAKPLDKRREALKAAGKISPYVKMGRAAYETATRGHATVPVEKNKVLHLDKFDSIMRALGFTSTKQSLYWAKKNAK